MSQEHERKTMEGRVIQGRWEQDWADKPVMTKEPKGNLNRGTRGS